MKATRQRILIIGYGNPGRRDDGLGPALAAALERLAPPPNVTIDADYQLTVEHAAEAAKHDIVIFADAATSGPEPFSLARVEPASGVSFTTHSVSPAEVLGLSQDLFHATPRACVLGIRGYEFNEFGEELSAPAQANLAAAVQFVQSVVQEDGVGTGRIDPADAIRTVTVPAHGDATCKLAST